MNRYCLPINPSASPASRATAEALGSVQGRACPIRILRPLIHLTGDELIDAVPARFDLSDQEVVELLLTGCDVEVEEGALTREQSSRHRAILKGQEQPREHLSKEELIQQAKALKAPAARTEMSWRSALDDFLAHAAVTHPTSATSQHAIAYRSWLLERLSASTIKTRLAFLSGFWSVLCELRSGINEAKLKQQWS